MARSIDLTNHERVLAEDELIVSKTDLRGRITYVNPIFRKISGYTAEECMDQPHSMIRHPAMPRAVFKLLWETVEAGREIFAYVNNRCKNGDNYWVFAHVTPVLSKTGEVVGYHSNRRFVRRAALEVIEPVYQRLSQIENQSSDRKSGLKKSFEALQGILSDKGTSYDRFILSI